MTTTAHKTRPGRIRVAAGIPNARLRLIDHAGHNPHDEQPGEVMATPCSSSP